jgi:hypothetical protein
VKRWTNILTLLPLLAVMVFAAREAAEKDLPRKACRFVTYVTTVQSSEIHASLVEHLMLGLYYANETCAARPERIS